MLKLISCVINVKNRTVKVLVLIQRYQKSICIGIANILKSIVNNPAIFLYYFYTNHVVLVVWHSVHTALVKSRRLIYVYPVGLVLRK